MHFGDKWNNNNTTKTCRKNGVGVEFLPLSEVYVVLRIVFPVKCSLILSALLAPNNSPSKEIQFTY